jgi:dihydrofolate reductase
MARLTWYYGWNPLTYIELLLGHRAIFVELASTSAEPSRTLVLFVLNLLLGGALLLAGRANARSIPPDSRVTLHMAASLDGFIARKDGRVDWLETQDEFAGGDTLSPADIEAFLGTIDCYVMGSRTYETALAFEAKGLAWSYGDKPTFVLTSRDLPRIRETIEFYSGDLAPLVNERLRPSFRSIWFVGGGKVAGECLRRGLADEIRYSILPILIGEGISFFEEVASDIALHLAEVKAYKNGIVDLRYEVRDAGR